MRVDTHLPNHPANERRIGKKEAKYCENNEEELDKENEMRVQ